MTPSRPSWATHGYYRTAILPITAKELGFERAHEAHAHWVAGFYGLDPRGELPSMADMSQAEAGNFIDWVIRECAEIGIILPDPRPKAARR